MKYTFKCIIIKYYLFNYFQLESYFQKGSNKMGVKENEWYLPK